MRNVCNINKILSFKTVKHSAPKWSDTLFKYLAAYSARFFKVSDHLRRQGFKLKQRSTWDLIFVLLV